MSSAGYGILEGYNPTLPSSSAVERLFGAAAQVPTARRNTQSAYLSPITVYCDRRKICPQRQNQHSISKPTRF